MVQNQRLFHSTWFFITIGVCLFACKPSSHTHSTEDDYLAMNAIELDIPESDGSFGVDQEGNLGLNPALIAQGVNLAVKGVRTLIEKSSERAYAEYDVAALGQQFYNSPSSAGPLDPRDMKFGGFEFSREVTVDGKNEAALYLRFAISQENLSELYKTGNFYLELDSMSLSYAKADLRSRFWFAPWTWFSKNAETLDMDIDLTLSSSWIDANTQIHRGEEIGRFLLDLRDVPFTEDKEDWDAWWATQEGRLLEGHSFIPPRSLVPCPGLDKGQNCYGTALLDAHLQITESSPNAKKQQVMMDYSLIGLEKIDAKAIEKAIGKMLD